jgi:hypothetical protein
MMQNLASSSNLERGRRRLALALLLTAIAGATLVIACGPDFPAQLLDDRKGALLATPSNSFVYEVSHLVPVPAGDKLKAVETSYEDALQADGQKGSQKASDPTVWQFYRQAKAQAAAITEVPADADDEPNDDGGGDTAADAAHPGPASAPPLDAASQAFRDRERDKAARAFEAVRKLVQAGADDSEGLAVSSFGEEAKMYLDGPNGACHYEALANNDPCTDAIPAADMKRAIRLYAEQAAHGSDSGLNSLRALADWAIYDPERVRKLIDDPIARHLLVSYALSRLGDIVDDKPDSAFDTYAMYDINGQHGLADAGSGNSHVKPNPLLVTLADALAALPASQADGADRIAALAYRAGRYDLAGQLADRVQTPLSWWVRAKLATRKGDAAAAAAAYAQAIQAFPQNGGSLEPSSQARLRGEQGVLSLSRGQYVQALDQLYRASLGAQPDSVAEDGSIIGDYWNDVAYVAERVLTTDELRAYVDAHVPASPVPAVDMTHMDANAQNAWMMQHPIPASDRLRQLLARRLMRDGARTQAITYFPADDDARFLEGVWADSNYVWKPRHLRQSAADYDAALKQARDAWRDTTRARAWYTAALLARRQGMDLLGYEQDPDYAVYDGGYTYGAGRDADPNTRFNDNASTKADTPAERAARDLPGPYVTEEERRRYASSEAKPYARFHYREIAADHAVAAADLLPARSQAYAATLCRATRFIIDDDPDRASSIYKRYIKEGAAVPFGATFGRDCPEPDFRGAERFPYVQAWHKVRRHPIAAALAGAAGIAVLVALTMGAVRLRRRNGDAGVAQK